MSVRDVGSAKASVCPDDSISQVASSTSGTSSIRRLELSARRAALEAEAAFAAQRQAIEMQELKLRQQKEDLERRSRLAAIQAEDNVLAEEPMFVRGELHDKSPVFPQSGHEVELVGPEAADVSTADHEVTFNPHAAEWRSHRYAEPDNAGVVLRQLVDQGQRQQTQLLDAIQLPAAHLQTFDGDPLRYFTFIRLFETNVEKSTVDDSSRLARLMQYCTGKAKQVISCCSVMNPKEGYAQAKALLKRRFGDNYTISQAWVDKVIAGPNLRPSDREALQALSDDLCNCHETLKAMGNTAEVNNQRTLVKIVMRLPPYLQYRWRREVGTIRKHTGDNPAIEHLTNFVREAAEEANDPIYGKTSDSVKTRSDSETDQRKVQRRTVSAVTLSEDMSQSHARQTSRQTSQSCPLCSQQHSLFGCQAFKSMKVEDRFQFAKENKLCFNCLSSGHVSSRCKSSWTCNVPNCGKRHNKLLHSSRPVVRGESGINADNNPVQNGFADVDITETCCATGAGSGGLKVALPIVSVQVRAAGQNQFLSTYALLDSGSTNTFCCDELLKQLGVVGKKSLLSLTTLEKVDSLTETKVVSLEVADMDENATLNLPVVYTRSKLPIHMDKLAQAQDISRWAHLEDLEFPEVDVKSVSLLIGQDTPAALVPVEVRRGAAGAPYAVKTVLGWTLNGPIGKTDSQKATVNFVHACGDNVLEQQVKQFWEIEGVEMMMDESTHLSVNDRKVVSLWEDSVKMVDGHYELAIPFKYRPPVLPNNRVVAERRLNSLRNKLIADPKRWAGYRLSMAEMFDKGFAVKVPKEELRRSDGAVWYLPHHGVSSVHKPDKVRIVFDCAATFRDVALNKLVMQGPDLTNRLIGVLMRFRQDHIAVLADIESMYHQVRVTPRDRDVLRFLWWPAGDTSQDPEEYRMTVHLFGGVWSPSCANFALRHTADDNRNEFDDEVIRCVQRNFYVDDCLKSVGSVEEAILLVNNLTKLLSRGGFHLTKWISNSSEVLDTIPEHEKAKRVRNLDMPGETTRTERALGTVWDTDSDRLAYRTVENKRPLTRRGILSTLSSVFDPLGLVSPYILPAKAIVQDLCRRNIGWDEPVPPDIMIRWLRWTEDLARVEQLKVDRCIKFQGVGKMSFSLHHFCDASQVGYGVASYLRSADVEGHIGCSLLMGKSRLSLIKALTIPRLELSAAALAVKIDILIHAELDFELGESIFWTDSTIVLSYIKNVDKRFQTFVANRVSIIHGGSTPHQWRHVRGELNPADDVSRGLTLDELMNSDRWFNGPSFLLADESTWPTMPDRITDLSELEVKAEPKAFTSVGSSSAVDIIDRLFKRHSSWYALEKNVAWILRVKQLLRKGEENSPIMSAQLTVEEIKQAEHAIIQYVQKQAFERELEFLEEQKADKNVKSKASKKGIKALATLYKLDPVLSRYGIICVGGRLRNSDLNEDMIHQAILPKKHPVVSLIIRHYHVAVNHAGKEHTLAALRERYWIIKARVAIHAELKNCCACRRQAVKPSQQKMADLPSDRVTAGKPPFTYVGIDYFGPFAAKQGRSVVKRYGCLFTCLTVRAVHVEVAHSLDTDTFINALQRFICRRGRPEVIRSDNGTNFVGAERELREALKKLNQTRISEFLRQREICWKFNPPAASHMGGVWERMIRSVRKILSSIMKEQTLCDEVLMTLLCQVEATINSRPITAVSDDPNDLQPLTPNHLLLLRSSTSLPAGEFEQRETYRKRWKQVQYLSDVFWRRWIHEYLPSLQCRLKWLEPKRNFKVDDVVIVIDESMPRNCWPLGRITDVFAGDDGLVRSVQVKTSANIVTRPVTKVCLLEAVE